MAWLDNMQIPLCPLSQPAILVSWIRQVWSGAIWAACHCTKPISVVCQVSALMLLLCEGAFSVVGSFAALLHSCSYFETDTAAASLFSAPWYIRGIFAMLISRMQTEHFLQLLPHIKTFHWQTLERKQHLSVILAPDCCCSLKLCLQGKVNNFKNISMVMLKEESTKEIIEGKEVITGDYSSFCWSANL